MRGASVVAAVGPLDHVNRQLLSLELPGRAAMREKTRASLVWGAEKIFQAIPKLVHALSSV